MPTLDEIRAHIEAASHCEHDWASSMSPVRSRSHNPSGRCIKCGKSCVEVFPGRTNASCEVCQYFKDEAKRLGARVSNLLEKHEADLAARLALGSEAHSQATRMAIPPASENMPVEVRTMYEDARNVSPRSASALLRVACEDLCRMRRIPRGKDGFYGTIQNLREREGNSPLLADALDAIRITGNDAVHGNPTDYDVPAEELFRLVNIIVDEWSNIDAVASVYGALPDRKKARGVSPGGGSC